MPYPPRPQLKPLPEFAGTAKSRPAPAVQARVERFILDNYAAGRSLRELAELTDRSHSAVRNILDKHGVRRRDTGAVTIAGHLQSSMRGMSQRSFRMLASNLLRSAREKTRTSPAELAERAGVPRFTVEQIEAGTRQPLVSTLGKLLAAMGLELRTQGPKRGAKLPDLSPAQVVRLQDALLANADALLTSALAVLDLGHVALARSLAILGLEESGKAIAIHDRRIQMAHAPEGTPFRCDRLDRLWLDHQKKLEMVHSFLVEERYWFDTEPPDPEKNEAHLGKIQKWADRHDRLKQRGFYVSLDKTGAALTPTHVADEESLADVINYVHQIGWQLRLGEHIEGKRQDEQEQGSPPADAKLLALLEDPDRPTPPELLDAMRQGTPGKPINNAAYRFNQPSADQTPFLNMGKPGYEAETRELLRLADEVNPEDA
ncbi:abortive infection protein, AbiV family [Geodermatophilus pulveris]|uniref:Abortive infection protein, AbiV family n=1 Tax=Geodermatophilus pulveris TaxID=1564159 RepID=A0A239GKL5_9ACTN|nr:AbiV family abortive infection protein [Geodermatophilus pulveris]SNS69836.1 abortive infection protein, AbiV family [Geodermatophilus pulveris]